MVVRALIRNSRILRDVLVVLGGSTAGIDGDDGSIGFPSLSELIGPGGRREDYGELIVVRGVRTALNGFGRGGGMEPFRPMQPAGEQGAQQVGLGPPGLASRPLGARREACSSSA
jgi:hypothetical protein